MLWPNSWYSWLELIFWLSCGVYAKDEGGAVEVGWNLEELRYGDRRSRRARAWFDHVDEFRRMRAKRLLLMLDHQVMRWTVLLPWGHQLRVPYKWEFLGL